RYRGVQQKSRTGQHAEYRDTCGPGTDPSYNGRYEKQGRCRRQYGRQIENEPVGARYPCEPGQVVQVGGFANRGRRQPALFGNSRCLGDEVPGVVSGAVYWYNPFVNEAKGDNRSNDDDHAG